MKRQIRKRGRGYEVYYTRSTKATPSRADLEMYVEKEAMHLASLVTKRDGGRVLALVLNRVGNGLHLALCDSEVHEVIGECMIYPCGCYTGALNRLHGLLIYSGAFIAMEEFSVVKNY